MSAYIPSSVVITGSNGALGIGFISHFIKSPHAKHYKGIYVVRSPERAAELKEVLKKAPKDHSYDILSLDLSTLAHVRVFAASLNAKVSNGEVPPIRALILNAAMQQVSGRSFTSDGFELHFGMNYLANFLLVLLVLQSMDKENGRIINVASSSHDAHHWGTRANYPEEVRDSLYTDTEALAKGHLTNEPKDNYTVGMRRYGTSKLLGVMWIYELQRRLETSSAFSYISCINFDPGALPSCLTRDSPFSVQVVLTLMRFLNPILVWIYPSGYFRTPSQSGSDLLFATFDEGKLGEIPRALYVDGTQIILSSKESRDEEKQKRLWKDTLEYVDIKDGDTVLEP
ncbi:putative short-chain dehydrogenase [Lentinula aciculospora]|uniref:Short-chain dehydrogenase n=1 Tax=Lentinula aciculospora TaxID=153920 RepID=A0A9W9AFX2_9AGAR|nr:putative short-chain dehydrogenase [Lentinula aciculospora]